MSEEFGYVDTCSDDILVCAFNDAFNDEDFLEPGVGAEIYSVTTAYSPGADAAVRLYGLSAQTEAVSDYFLEDEESPLTLTVYSNGTTSLTGRVRAPEPQSDIAYDVDMQFEDGMTAQAFG